VSLVMCASTEVSGVVFAMVGFFEAS